MTYKMKAASPLAALALFVVSAAVAAQTPATPAAATKPASSSTALPTATEEEIQTLRGEIRAKRKGVVAANMTLTADEATRFWPLFDEYTNEVKKVNDKRWAMMREFVANYKTMTDAQAKASMETSAAVDAELITLRAKYIPQFEKLVSTKKVAQFYQLDRRLDLWMNLQLASLFPIVQATN